MKTLPRYILLLFVLLSQLQANAATDMFPPDNYDYTVGDRAWLVRPCYNRQSEFNFFEIGIGRMNSIASNEDAGLKKFRLASVGFTAGADFSFSDTSSIIAPKMGIEGCVTIFGGRISYGYYRQDNNKSGVIGIEGGICILSTFFAYVGYNFVKGNSDNPVITEGPKFSMGFNIPFLSKGIPPSKRLGKD